MIVDQLLCTGDLWLIYPNIGRHEYLLCAAEHKNVHGCNNTVGLFFSPQKHKHPASPNA